MWPVLRSIKAQALQVHASTVAPWPSTAAPLLAEGEALGGAGGRVTVLVEWVGLADGAALAVGAACALAQPVTVSSSAMTNAPGNTFIFGMTRL